MLGRDLQVLIQGASRGIGLEFVRQCLALPAVARVFATCRAPERATALSALAQDAGGRLQVLRLDVVDEASVAAAAGAVSGATLTLDLVVNCAGVLHDTRMAPERRLAEVDPEALVASYRVNALGPLLVAKHFATLLPCDRRAVFASISARVGSIGDNRLGGWYAYRMAKAAQNMMTRTLAVELARRNREIVCVGLHPGTTDTDLSRPFQRNVPPHKLFSTERSVGHLLDVIGGLTSSSSGRVFAWDGTEIPP